MKKTILVVLAALILIPIQIFAEDMGSNSEGIIECPTGKEPMIPLPDNYVFTTKKELKDYGFHPVWFGPRFDGALELAGVMIIPTSQSIALGCGYIVTKPGEKPSATFFSTISIDPRSSCKYDGNNKRFICKKI